MRRFTARLLRGVADALDPPAAPPVQRTHPVLGKELGIAQVNLPGPDRMTGEMPNPGGWYPYHVPGDWGMYL